MCCIAFQDSIGENYFSIYYMRSLGNFIDAYTCKYFKKKKKKKIKK